MDTLETQFQILLDDHGSLGERKHVSIGNRTSVEPSPQDDASSESDFKFVNISSPSEIKGKDTRKFIRRSVACNYRRKQQLIHAGRSRYGSHSCIGVAKSADIPKNFCQVCGYSLRKRSRSRSPSLNSIEPQHGHASTFKPAFFGHKMFDPFDSFPIPEKPYIHALVEYCQWLIPGEAASWNCSAEWNANVRVTDLASYCPTLQPFGKWDRSTSPIVTGLFRLAIQNQIYFHCILCIAATHYDLSSNRKTFNTVACFHRGEAIKLLNAMLQDENCVASELMIATVGSLAQYDVLVGDVVALENHRVGMITMINMRGGIDDIRLDNLVRHRALWIDMMSAAYTHKAPYFQTSGFEPTYSGELNFTTIAATGFRPLLGTLNNISPLLQSLEELVSLANDLRIVKETRPSSEDICSFTARRSLIERGLCKLPDDGHIGEGVEPCCRFATLIYTNTVLRRLPFGSAVLAHFANELQVALNKTNLVSLWDENIELLMWILFQGATAATKKEVARWYLRLLAAVCHTLQLQRWSDVLEVLEKFLWVRDDVLERCKALWNEIAVEIFER